MRANAGASRDPRASDGAVALDPRVKPEGDDEEAVYGSVPGGHASAAPPTGTTRTLLPEALSATVPCFWARASRPKTSYRQPRSASTSASSLVALCSRSALLATRFWSTSFSSPPTFHFHFRSFIPFPISFTLTFFVFFFVFFFY